MTPMADDRDTLSALFDGELRDDAARFAARRLGHDVEWRQSVERWQLIGDVMRGQASTLAPSGFAERVAQAIAVPVAASDDLASSIGAADVAPGSSARAASKSRARVWGGMALAASVAAVAALVMPSMRQAPPPAVPVVSTPAVSPAATPVTPPTIATDATQVAIAPAPRPQGRSARPASARLARAQPRPTSAPSRAQSAEPVRVATRPFQPPVDDIAPSRPWPRATLPGLQSGGAFTAGYATGGARGEAPSFYPFEPDAQSAAAAPSPSP